MRRAGAGECFQLVPIVGQPRATLPVQPVSPSPLSIWFRSDLALEPDRHRWHESGVQVDVHCRLRVC
jgi:hypothetical protein